jgi:integrating conjugative element protein (TIGR03758 family)
VYNGSCCYGVLQMSRSNILEAGMTAEQFRSASLQTQIDAWADLQSRALKDPVIASLQTMGTFDGQPVDASMMISCVQLGQGNCRKMVNSGKCNGFEDSNGTDICEMAAKTRAAIGAAGPEGVVGPVVPFLPAAYSGNGIIPSLAAAAEPPEQAYQTASGISMSDTAHAIKSVAASLMLTFLLWTVVGTWGAFVKGKLTLHAMTETIVRGTVITIIVLMLTLG